MPDPKLQAYLAQHYLSGPKADAILARQDGADGKKRRKKRKVDDSAATGGGLLIKDDLESWKQSVRALDEDEDDESGRQVVQEDAEAKRQARFKKAFRADQAAEEVVEPEAEDERPEIAGADGLNLGLDDQASIRHAQQHEQEAQAAALVQAQQDASGPSTASAAAAPAKKQRSGLITKEEMRAERMEREAREAEKRAKENAEAERLGEEEAAHHQTIYRDKSGRRINVEEEDEAARQEAIRQAQREKEKATWGRGMVQKAQARAGRERMEEMKGEGVARYANDRKMNDQLRQMDRADDPAFAFLTKKRDKGPRMPKYSGPPPPPNRFGIQPGYRWDGVDRSNGFEKLYFQKINERSRRTMQAQGEWRQVRSRAQQNADSIFYRSLWPGRHVA